MTKRIARGHRPEFSSDPQVDKLVSIVMNMAADMSVMRERMDTIERLAAERDLFSSADIDAFEITPEIDAEREKWTFYCYCGKAPLLLHRPIHLGAWTPTCSIRHRACSIPPPVPWI